tara:strand:- start:58 stop:990 length:933 start_codon:yes stop_codon:yes gene_type:complete
MVKFINKKNIIIFLFLFFFVQNSEAKVYRYGSELENKFIISKKFNIPLSEGKWVSIRNEKVVFYGITQSINGIARIENNELQELIEVYKGWGLDKFMSQINTLIHEAVFKNQYDGCYERSEYYLVEVFKKGSSHNCYIVRHLETKKELNNPDDPQLRGVAAQYNKYIRENNIILPEITLASEHSFFSRTTGGKWYRIVHAINPKILNSPDINSFTEESSEYHRSNISEYPEHKKIMEQWISISSKNHKRLEKIFRAKKHQLLNLDKYIKENNIENKKNNVVEDLKKLNELYKSGAITKEEFKKAKKKLLN